MRPAPLRPRPDDWPEQLAAHCAEHRAREFAWGSHDCATFVCDWVVRIAGVDPMADWRGAYADEEGFAALVWPVGGLAPFVAAAAARAGIPPCPPRFAQRGDAAICRYGNTECLGIVTASGIAVPTLAGIRIAPRAGLRLAWAV